MKSFLRISIILVLFATKFWAQQGQILVTLQQPPPNQLNVSNLWKLTLNNISQNTFKIFLEGTIDEASDGRILEAKSQSFDISPGLKIYGAGNFNSASVSFKINKYKETIVRTGNAPSGSYTMCIYVKSNDGSDINSDCKVQVINNVSPPMLISPANEDTLKNKFSTFSWTPPGPLSPNTKVFYKFQIVEIIGRQLPEEAFKNNIPFVSVENISSNVYQVPVSNESFSEGKDYAWKISASTDGTPLGESEIWKFSFGKDMPPIVSTTCQEKIIKRFIKLYNGIYNLGIIMGDVIAGKDAGHFGYQQFLQSGYIGCIELHGNCDNGSLWIGYPERHFISWEDGSVQSTKWFEYKYTISSGLYVFNFNPTANMPCPPYPNLNGSDESGREDIRPKIDGAWANYIAYDPVAVLCDKFESLPGSKDVGTCIPHYSHILIPEGPKINEIHSSFQNPLTFSTTQKLLEDAKPTACYDLPGKKEIDEILWVACPPELRVIGWVMGDDLCKKISKKITDVLFRICPELKKRNQKGWQTSTLRGFVSKADNPENDLAMDHTAMCYSGGDEHTGPIYPPTAVPPSPYNDWDMKINADNDVKYLTSDVKPEIVGVEIEKWLVPTDYQPIKGDYFQCMGRWVIDNGHPQDDDVNDGFYTEIHPPELMVSSNLVGDGTITEARAIVVGSWLGNDLKFLVWPIPRPDAGSILKDTVLIERADRCEMEVKKVPADNPNHLECTIKNTGTGQPSIEARGFVLYSCLRGFQGIIQAWWEKSPIIYTKKDVTPPIDFGTEVGSKYTGKLPEKDNDSKSGYIKIESDRLNDIITHNFKFNINGKIDCAGLSKNDCYIFFRNEGESSSVWESKKIDEDGRFSINAIYGGKYKIIPSSLKYKFSQPSLELTIDSDFVRGSLKNMVYVLKGSVDPGFNSLIDYTGISELGSDFDYQKDPRLREYLLDKLKDQNLLSSFDKQFKKRFLQVIQPDGSETENENMQMIENNGMVYLHLANLVDTTNSPIGYLSACLLSHVNNMGVRVPFSLRTDSISPFLCFPLNGLDNLENQEKDYLLVQALKGLGSSDATVKAKLLVGNETSGYKLVNESIGKTDSKGNVKFNFTTGNNFGSGKIVFEVINNPANPWFLPKVETESYLFPPLNGFNGSGQNGTNFNSFRIEQKQINYENLKVFFANKMNPKSLSEDEKNDREFLQEMAEVHESDLWEDLTSFLIRYQDNIYINMSTIINQ